MPNKEEVSAVCQTHGIKAEDIIYRDAFNVEQYTKYKGMACVVVPQMERAFIFAAKTSGGYDRLIEVRELKPNLSAATG